MTAADALTADRKALVEQMMWRVKAMARRRHRTARSVSVEELESAGYWALVRYIPTHNPDRGSLDAFMGYRISKAMLKVYSKKLPQFEPCFRNETFALKSPVVEMDEVEALHATNDDVCETVRLSVELAAFSAFLSHMFAPPTTPEEEVLDREERARLRVAIERSVAELPVLGQRLFDAFFVQGRSVDEISKASGISDRSVDRALKGVREALRAALATSGDQGLRKLARFEVRSLRCVP